jgi:dipeptide transport system permease protein
MLLVPVFFGVTLVAFGFIRVLPGDPVEVLAGERGLSTERHAELLAQLGFDKPIWQQYLNYLTDILHGDLGTSLITNRPVVEEFF